MIIYNTCEMLSENINYVFYESLTSISWAGKTLKISCHPCQSLRQRLISNFLLMTKVLQMCRLQNTTNISHMTTLTLLSLRNTEVGVSMAS